MRCSDLLRWAAVCAALLIAVAPAAAQEGHGHGEHQMSAEDQAMMEAYQAAATPGPQHALLASTAGTYKVTAKVWHQPGTEPMVSEGQAVRTMTLGGRVLEEEYTGSMMEMQFEGLARTGYDNVTKSWWTTWTDNMSTALMVLHGTMNEDGSATFEGQVPDPMTGGTKTMKIVTTKDGAKEIHKFYEPGPDGSDVQTMELVYEPAG